MKLFFAIDGESEVFGEIAKYITENPRNMLWVYDEIFKRWNQVRYPKCLGNTSMAWYACAEEQPTKTLEKLQEESK